MDKVVKNEWVCHLLLEFLSEIKERTSKCALNFLCIFQKFLILFKNQAMSEPGRVYLYLITYSSLQSDHHQFWEGWILNELNIKRTYITTFSVAKLISGQFRSFRKMKNKHLYFIIIIRCKILLEPILL